MFDADLMPAFFSICRRHFAAAAAIAAIAITPLRAIRRCYRRYAIADGARLSLLRHVICGYAATDVMPSLLPMPDELMPIEYCL